VSIFRHIIIRIWFLEEFPDRGLVEKGHAEDTKHIKGTSVKLEIMLNNSNKAIGRNSRVNLDSNSIFGHTPKRLYVQMLLYPFKKKFHLPSIFIKQHNVFCADSKVISKVSKGSFMFQREKSDPPKQNRIFFPGLLSCKSYNLIIENVIRVFKKVLAFNDFILKLPSLPNYEVGSNKIDCKEPSKIKISPVKDVVGIRFIRNFIHGFHIINFGFRNMKKGRDLSNDIIKGMDLDTAFGLAKTCPPEKVQAQVNGSGIKCIKPTTNLKFFCDSFSLGDRYHLIGKFFKDLAIPVCVCFCQIAASYHRFTETQMVRLGRMSGNYADKLSEAFTTRQLSIHHDQQLIPATKRLDVFVTLVFHNNPIKNPFGKKLNKLAEYVFSIVHDTRFIKPDTIYNFKSTR
jgi:hypothetical protein